MIVGKTFVKNEFINQIKQINMKVNFKNKLAREYYEYLTQPFQSVLESGIDDNGRIYICYLNGIINRYTRREFIREAKEFYSEQNN